MSYKSRNQVSSQQYEEDEFVEDNKLEIEDQEDVSSEEEPKKQITTEELIQQPISKNQSKKYKFSEDEGYEQETKVMKNIKKHRKHIQTTEKSFGNYIVLYSNKSTIICLGPDYWCFLPTFICFAIASYFIIGFVMANSQNFYWKLCTWIICLGECLAYLMVALSNPGIVLKMHIEQQSQHAQIKFCSKCKLYVPSNSYHCSYCNVCIEQYDHHCPWTSKCIGKKNLIQFYVFLFMTPLFILYISFAFVFAAGVSGRHTVHLKKQAAQVAHKLLF